MNHFDNFIAFGCNDAPRMYANIKADNLCPANNRDLSNYDMEGYVDYTPNFFGVVIDEDWFSITSLEVF